MPQSTTCQMNEFAGQYLDTILIFKSTKARHLSLIKTTFGRDFTVFLIGDNI